jgi:hypothetical protein
MEMRITICKLIVLFDFQLLEKDLDWANQDAYIIWSTKSLLVNVNPRHGASREVRGVPGLKTRYERIQGTRGILKPKR